jgi:Polyketide cyclase / dehydrase and lipid transport
MKRSTILFLLGWFALLLPGGSEQVLAQPKMPASVDETASMDLAHGSEAAASFPRQPGPTWSLESDRDGITVYSRKTENSSIREVLAETTIPAPLGRVLKAIEDYRNYPEFMPYVEESAVLEESEGKTRLFLQLGFPPPISDRFYTIVLQCASDPLEPGALLVFWDVARDDLSRQKGRGIEVTINRGGWRLQSTTGAGTTRVLYYVHTDPGGFLPAWAVNLANTVAVPKVIMGLKKRVLSHSY